MFPSQPTGLIQCLSFLRPTTRENTLSTVVHQVIPFTDLGLRDKWAGEGSVFLCVDPEVGERNVWDHGQDTP